MAIDKVEAVGPSVSEHEDGLLHANVQESNATKMHTLSEVLSSIKANYDRFTERYCDLINKLNQLEMDCINLIQLTDEEPMESRVEHLREKKSNLTSMMSNNDKHIPEK